MEKSYDENLAKLMAEARDLFKSANFADSARKYLEAASNQEAARGLAQAEDLYHEAIRNFIRASEENKEKKQYRMSAQNLYYVAYIFKKLGSENDWKAATKAVVEDLINAAQEYLMWNEYDRGIILVSTACFFLFSIEDFGTAEQYYLKYIDQIKDDPGFTRAQQILYAAGYAIKAVKDSDTTALLNAQQLVGSHLKPGLSQIVGELFFPAIDSAMDTVVKHFRSKIKLPKIIPEIQISRDLVIGEPAKLTIFIENEGQGDAYNISFKINIPEHIDVIQGNKEFSIKELAPNKTVDQEITIRCLSSEGEEKHELSANLTFYDQLQTKQTMMIGPYDLLFREKSLTRELAGKLAELSTINTSLLRQFKEKDIILEEIGNLIIDVTSDIIRDSEELLQVEEFETIQANIKNVKKIHEVILKLTSDEFANKILEQRKQIIDNELSKIREEITEEYNQQIEQLKQEHSVEIANLEESFKEEKEKMLEEFQAEKEKEQKELLEKLELRHQKDLTDLKEEHQINLEQALEEQRKRFEEEKKKLLEEQETVLRSEFQRLLSDTQEKKKR
ncbi:MAG: hypothetical protein ACTSYV_02905 [Candidatus Heimdallarchaeaceae archaeon]